MKTLVRQFIFALAMLGPAFAGAAEMPTLAAAVERARAGDYESALAMFAELREADPDDPDLLADETVVLVWAGDNEGAVTNAAAIDPASAADYVVSAVAKAYRNTHAYVTAADWYGVLVDRDAGNVDANSGRAMSLADAGHFDEAHRTLAEAPGDTENAPQLLLAEAYVYELAGRYIEALGSYQRALESEPDNRDALRGKALVLRAALLPQQALAIARAHPGLLSEEEIEQLEVDVAALQLRYGTQASYVPERRFHGIDIGLAELDRLLANPSLEPDVRERLLLDRVLALSSRARTAEAIEAFEALPIAREDVPAYVLSSVGSAYLQERKPEEARDVLETAVALDPANVEHRFRLFFAYTDLHEYDKALELSETLLAELPPIRSTDGSHVTRGSYDHLHAAILRGLADAYADQLEDSQSYFEALLAKLPNNTDVRQELANVYHWRGWLDLSLEEYGRVLAVEPELVSARVGHAHTQFDNRDYVRVEEELDWLTEKHRHEGSVRNLETRWQLHNRSEVAIDARFGESSGSTFGQDQYTVDAIWLSQPIAYHFRAYVNTHDDFAEFPEGSVRRQRIGAGAEYRYRRWYGRAGLSAPRGGGGGIGLRASGEYRLNDVLRIGGRLETESNATPLRGEGAGVSSNLIGLNAYYAQNELTAFYGDLSFQDLSDGNEVAIASLGGAHRIVNRARYKLTVMGDVAGERRSKGDVAYFSPERAFTWMAGARGEMPIYRRYNIDLAHSLTGRFGFYDQKGFSSDDVWSVDYVVRGELYRRWHGYLGLSRSSHVYDGTREYATFVLAGIGGRF
jgi:biofilm PGA synthesis protein PgaA